MPRASRSQLSSKPTARRGRTAVVCAAVGWIALQLASSAAIDRWAPEMRDPEFGNKLARLRSGQRGDEAPLVVVIGSSRSDYGICPAALNAEDAASERPRVFNFAMMGAGPITQLAMLQELLASGIRPDGVLVEVNPLLLHQTGGFAEQEWLRAERLDHAGMQVLRRYSSRPSRVFLDWLRARLTPCYALRFLLVDRFAPRWLEPTHRQDRRTPPDDNGWLPHDPPQVTAEDRRWRIGRQLEQYALAFENFEVSGAPDRALRELLEVCRRERIPAGLFLMPEASEFRTALGAEAAGRLHRYVDGLCDEYDLALFDARAWLSDRDFADGEHLLPEAARQFTRRLSRVAQPLLAEICLNCNPGGRPAARTALENAKGGERTAAEMDRGSRKAALK